jgi:hypothetical protein
MAWPEMFLAPANVVAVYLRDHAMCTSWDWADTAALNARMLPVVQAVLGDPGIDEPRVALAFSIAGLFLYRALLTRAAGQLHGRPERDFLEEVYGKIRDGLETIQEVTDAVQRGEVSEPLAYEWFVVDTAKLCCSAPWASGCRCGGSFSCVRWGPIATSASPSTSPPWARTRIATVPAARPPRGSAGAGACNNELDRHLFFARSVAAPPLVFRPFARIRPRLIRVSIPCHNDPRHPAWQPAPGRTRQARSAPG